MANRTSHRSALAVAAVVHDQDNHSAADLAFLDAMSRADREWIDALNSANITWGGGSEAWQIVKRLATRTRDQAYVAALAALEASDFEDAELLEAAE